MSATVSVSLGIDHLIASGQLSGRRIGLVCNPASVDATLRHSADRLWDEPAVTLAALFGPQHGFRSDAQDNMIETPHAKHPRFDVPIYSLYNDNREPSADMLNELEVLVIDLQDVGTRVYTYAYTMANCLRAAKRHGTRVGCLRPPKPDRRRAH